MALLSGAAAFTGTSAAFFSDAFSAGSAFLIGVGEAAGFESKNEKNPPLEADSSFLVGVGVAAGFTGSTFFGGSGALAASLVATGAAVFTGSTFLAG